MHSIKKLEKLQLTTFLCYKVKF